MQEFINASFDSITDIEQSLGLLKRFQQILQRERLKSDLDSKFNVIFQNYGLELEKIQKLYEKHKHAPPIPRNLPPVAGNITWSRHLLKRIEEPMKKFETNQNVLASRDAKRIIRMYNKVSKKKRKKNKKKKRKKLINVVASIFCFLFFVFCFLFFISIFSF